VLPTAIARHLLFALALALVSAGIVALMTRAGVLDHPDARKAHTRPIPKGGGVGVVAAFLLGMALLYRYAEFARIADPYFRGVILASIVMALVALADDVNDWPFAVKLTAQLIAAGLAIGSGLAVWDLRVPDVGAVSLGWAGPVATLAWLLFTTNAVNFMDGLNGLVSGTCLVASACLAAIAASQGGWFAYAASGLLASGLAGFIPFNYPRARIFLGDVGSQFCGFVLAVLGVAAARFATVELSALLVPMLLSGLLLDAAFTLARRLLMGEPVTQPHRGHLYQVAHRAGVPAVAIAPLHWAFAAWGGAVCAMFIAATGPTKALIPLLVLPPQIAWALYVVVRARRARLGRW
jgi:UDP-GlcNAc:undecaprenyl-phosphate/decaprenyl-phosphate GlcNAc-1-phosphate transferase